MSQPPNPPNPPQPPNPPNAQSAPQPPNAPPPPRPSAAHAAQAAHAPARKSNKTACLIIGGIVLVVFIVGAFAAVSFIGSLIKGGTEKLIQGGTEKVLEAATGATGVNIVNEDGKKGMTFKDKDGNEFQVTQSKEIPADFPKDVVNLYDGTVTRTGRTKIGDKTMWTVLIETPDDLKKVAQYLADQFAQNGWEVMTEQDSDNRSIRIAKKENYGMTVTYSRNQDDGQTNVNYMVQTQVKSE